MRSLLVIDGDSLAHRAYHAMPKTVRLGCVLGFTNMLLRLWQAEEPRAVLVGWDSIGQPTYRNEAFEAYQSGRVFDPELLEQLADVVVGELELLPRNTGGGGQRVARVPEPGVHHANFASRSASAFRSHLRARSDASAHVGD